MAVPSGKFWIPIPIDKIRAGTRLVLTLAMAIPTAKPREYCVRSLLVIKVYF